MSLVDAQAGPQILRQHLACPYCLQYPAYLLEGHTLHQILELHCYQVRDALAAQVPLTAAAAQQAGLLLNVVPMLVQGWAAEAAMQLAGLSWLAAAAAVVVALLLAHLVTGV